MPLIDGLTTLWDTLMSAQPDPPPLLVVVTAVVALAVVVARLPWRIARNAVTIAHEGGHALVALLTGRRLHGIRLHSDTSGLTLSAGRPTGPGMILTLLAGYVAPSLLGLGGAWLLAGNRITLLLWLAVALAVLLQVAVVHVGLLNTAFGTVPLEPGLWAVCVAMASVVLWYEELRKLAARLRRPSPASIGRVNDRGVQQ